MPANPTPEDLWHYLANQFDNVTKGRRKRMNAILADSFAKLTEGAASNAALVPVLAVLTAVKGPWDTAYGAWKERRAAWRSTTQEFDNLLAALRVSPGGGLRSKIDRWESKVAAFWAVSHAVYAYLFPQGREPFTVGGRDEIITEVKGLGERLATKSGELTTAAGAPGLPAGQVAELEEQADALDALGTEVTAFYNLMKDARSAQTVKEGLVDQAAATCEQRRVESATALYRALAKLMDIFAEPEVRMQVAGFFDLELIVAQIGRAHV